MRADWVPLSASCLVIGATALSVGAVLVPRSVSPWAALAVADQDPHLWLAVAGLSLFASVCLLLGLPAVVALLDGAWTRVGMAGAAVLAVGCLATAAYAVMLGMEPSERSSAVLSQRMGFAGDSEPALLLTGWALGFAFGELLLALAVLRSGRVSQWVPAVLIAHVALLPAMQVMPELLATASALLLTVAFAALGIAANQSRVPSSGGLRASGVAR